MKKNPGKIVIFGQYKTGTTGLFNKIQKSLPEGTRVLFESNQYIPEPSDESRWVLAKTILKEPGHPEPVDYDSFLDFDRRICICRDPRDWLVSATLFICQLKESIFGDDRAMAWVMNYLHQKEKSPRSLPLMALLNYIIKAPPSADLDVFGERSRARHAFSISFQKRLRGNLHLVRYEDFVDGRLGSLEEYLEIALDSGPCALDEAFAHVPRTCSYGNWKDWLTEEDVEFFRPFFADYILACEYDPDWTLSEHPAINPVHSSEYVSRVVQMKRRSVAATRA
jgi:hypothetical protein